MLCPSCGQSAVSSDPRCVTCGRPLNPVATDTPVAEVAPSPSPPLPLAADAAGPAVPPSQTSAAPPAPVSAGYAAPPTVPLYGPLPYGPYPPPGYAPPPYASAPWAAPYASYVPPLPYGPVPYQPISPPRRGRTALIVGLALLIAVVFTSGLGGAVYTATYYAQHGAIPFMATPTPTATPDGEIMLSDQLAANTYGWVVQPPQCQFANGGYQISDSICIAPIQGFWDGSIVVQARQIAGSLKQGYGIVLRLPTIGNYYAFDIASNGYWTFFKEVNGRITPIVGWRSTTAVARGLGVTNTLLVQFGGSHFDFFVNGSKVGQVNDSALRSGRVGLEAFQDTQVVFNNVTITNYP
jgi:hypothetical protein